MTQDVRDILARQQVTRVTPPVRFRDVLCFIAFWTGIAAASWALVLLIIGGIWFWADRLAEWWR